MTSWIRKSSNWYRLRKKMQQREPESPQIARGYRLVLGVAPADIVSEKWLKRIACLPACLVWLLCYHVSLDRCFQS